MRKTRRAVAALFVAAAAACFTAEAQAADTISFGDQGTKATFGANRVVSIDGTITYRDDCPVPGIKDFFYPATDAYLVPAGTATAGGKLQDVGGGSPNTIVSGASMFLDETIAMTAPAGNLDEGEYDVVFDTCQDGYYDPGWDTVFPDAVTVTLPDVLPLADNGIKAIKDESRQEYHAWLATKFGMQALFKLADQALKTECMAGSPVGCVLKNINYLSGVKQRFLALVLSQANHYKAIADDPPDASFDQATTIEPFDLPRDHSDSPFGNAVSDALQPFAGEAALNGALLHAIERYQGAQAAGDRKWALVHAREARNLTQTLRRIAPATSDALGDMKAAMSGDSAAFDQALSAGRSFAGRVRNSGFTGSERRALLNTGLSRGQIAKLETETRDLIEQDPVADSAGLIALLDQVRSAHAATVTALDTSAGWWDDIVKALETKPGPAAVDAGGPYTAVKGTPVTLAGSATGSAAWDLDADGAFDDATGATPSVTFDRTGTFVIGLRAGDGVSYAVVKVTDANHAPVLNTPVPASREATITVGGALPLSVNASDADADSLSYTWTVDGADAHDGDASLTYSPAAAQVGSHSIEVTVADGHGGTTRRAWDVVVLENDADNDGWTRTTDCDESDPAVHPTANELLGNGVDDDCDSATPDAPPGGLTGSLMSWGSNHNGTVGSGSYSPTLVSSPVPVPGLDNVVQVDQGDRAEFAVLDNGEVRGWGFNLGGGLGNGTQTGTGTPVSPLGVGGAAGSRLTGVTQLSAQEDGHVLARRTDGTVVAWGENQARQVGDGSTVNYRLYPAPVVTGEDGAPLTGVREVEAGVSDSYAIMDDGTVRAWGYVRCDGGTNIRPERFPVPLPLVGGNVKQISTGNQFTLILKKDGTVLSCGALQPAAGRPVASIPDAYLPKPLTGFGPGSGVIDISAGYEGGMALKSDGSLWAWGSNNNWELGILGYSGPASVNAPTQVPLPPGPPVVDIEMGGDSCHGLATRADGSVLGFGCDFFEQVGNGDGPGSGVMTPTVIDMPGKSTYAAATSSWNGVVITRPIADDWKAPATWVKASVADATVGEAGGTFKVSLSAALPYDVKVDWSTEAGTADSGDVSLADGVATVPAGATSVEVDAPVKDDALDEAAETFAVVLEDASNGVQLDRSQATVTIEDNDDPPTVSVKPASVAEGDTSLTDVPVKVRLSAPSGKPVSVSYATADGTAVSPGDYAGATGTLVIAPGDAEGIVHVAVRGDTVVEPDEALSVGISNPDNATLGDASAPLTITDDEPFALSVTSPTVTEGDSGTTPATFTVALDAAPPAGSSVSVDWKVAGVTATVPGDVAAANGTLTFAAGEKSKPVTVQVQGDTEDEGDEAFRLALTNPAATGDRVVLRGESPVATIVDDDDAPPPPPPPPPADTTAPVTTATAPTTWQSQNVSVALAATDNDGGSGVKQIVYTVGTATQTVSGATASVPVTAEGATTITYHAVDNAGNVEADKTVVVRIDKTAPTVTCSASPKTLYPADHRMVPITVTVKVTDSRSGSAGYTLQSVTSNEPDDAPGTADGATTGDISGWSAGTADVSGQLRAERSTSGHGRVYTLTYVGRDAAGNQRTCTTTVSAPVGCTGARALEAAREVQHARRRYARRLHRHH